MGTEAINQTRFEPVISGTFVRVEMATVAPASATVVKDLNPALTYTTSTIPQVQRDQSIGDPRGLVFNAAGTQGWVTGMGSNDVLVVDASGNRLGAPVLQSLLQRDEAV